MSENDKNIEELKNVLSSMQKLSRKNFYGDDAKKIAEAMVEKSKSILSSSVFEHPIIDAIEIHVWEDRDERASFFRYFKRDGNGTIKEIRNYTGTFGDYIYLTDKDIDFVIERLDANFNHVKIYVTRYLDNYNEDIEENEYVPYERLKEYLSRFKEPDWRAYQSGFSLRD